ncbi:hypothetical protein GCM10009675_19640 [Prauserella alba]|uniref:Uncharacterized protein n=1 Tax=Prauserella alba TaxID=176898 RepID=A0ABN1VAR3_9PSEU
MGVVGTHADQRYPRTHRRQELVVGVPAAVVRNLQDLRLHIDTAGQQVVLRGQLDVPGQQHPPGRGRGTHHHRRIVDRRAVRTRLRVLRPPVARLLTRRRCDVMRTEHVQGQLVPARLLADRELDDRHPVRACLLQDRLPRPRRRPALPHPDRSDDSAVEHRRQPPDVVGVEVAQYDQRHSFDVQPVEAAVDRPGVGPDVDDDGPAGRTGGQHDPVTLADVARHDRPARRRPPDLQEPRRYRHHECCRHPDRDGDARFPVPQRRDGTDGDACGGDPAPPPGGPGHDRAGDGSRLPRDDHEPTHAGPGQVHEDLRRGRQGHGQPGRRHAEHGDRRDHRRGEQIRGDRHDADLARHAGDDRCGGNEGGHGHGERLRRPRRYAPRGECSRPPGRQEDQTTGRDHRQREAHARGHRRIDEYQSADRHRQCRHHGATPAEHEGGQSQSAHDRGAQHARFVADEHHETGQRDPGRSRRGARAAPYGSGEQEHRAAHDGDVRTADRCEMGQSGIEELLFHARGLATGVADDEPGQQACLVVGKHTGDVPQRAAHDVGGTLPCRGSRDPLRRTAHVSHGHGQIPGTGGGQRSRSTEVLARQEPGPLACRGDEQYASRREEAAVATPPGSGRMAGRALVSGTDAHDVHGNQHRPDPATPTAVTVVPQGTRPLPHLGAHPHVTAVGCHRTERVRARVVDPEADRQQHQHSATAQNHG